MLQTTSSVPTIRIQSGFIQTILWRELRCIEWKHLQSFWMTRISDFHHSVATVLQWKLQVWVFNKFPSLPSKVFSGHCPAVSWADIQNASGQLRDSGFHNYVAGPAPSHGRVCHAVYIPAAYHSKTSCSNWSNFIISASDKFWPLDCELRCKRFAPMSIHPLRCLFFQSWRCQLCYENLARRAKHDFKLLQTRTNLSGWPSCRCAFSRIPNLWIQYDSVESPTKPPTKYLNNS